MKPVIGVNVDVRMGPPPEVSAQLPYLASIENSGGIPLLIPPMSDEDLDVVLRRVDGVMFIGGRDYHPRRYGQEIDDTVTLLDPIRDDFDFRLFDKVFHSTNLAILGICLGCQLINIALGGSLMQDIKKCIPHSEVTHPSNDGWINGFSTHAIKIEPGSYLHKIYQVDNLVISSSHHQGVDRLGKGLSTVAFADDGVVEAVELPGDRFVVGVQWHPERLYDESKGLFEEFIAACSHGEGKRKSLVSAKRESCCL